MAATINDIAKRLGKSSQLVSAVLNGGRSSAVAGSATREAILRLAAEFGYRPNAAARAVSTGKFGTIGLLLSMAPWKSMLHGHTLVGIQEGLAIHDWHLTVCNLPDETYATAARLPKALRSLMLDGLLIKYDSAMPDGLVERITGLGLPAVWLNSRQRCDCVHPDDSGAARQATNHLIGLGHRAIAYLDAVPREPSDHYASSARRTGYAEAMAAARLPARDLSNRILPVSERLAALDAWLAGPRRPTALVAAGPEEAQTAICTALRRGMRVPHDLSVVTFAEEIAIATGHSLTTLLIPCAELGRAAVAMLAAKMSAPRRRLLPQALPFAFAAGDTCAPPPAKLH